MIKVWCSDEDVLPVGLCSRRGFPKDPLPPGGRRLGCLQKKNNWFHAFPGEGQFDLEPLWCT